MESIIQKYNVPGPRYTSYPTVPYWNTEDFSVKIWEERLIKSFDESNDKGISLYIHLPFCESLCTFCGCNKRITKQHSVERPYINYLLKEWNLYLSLFKKRPLIKEIHLGGGTPTFFNSDNLRFLMEELLRRSNLAENFEFSFEGHPNNTTQAHLETLYDLGFRRVCYGVQDYNSTVQKAINRIQPFENVKHATLMARNIGYTSVGHDIIFGLPFQTIEDVKQTILKTAKLLPDRIAFYSYAHTPWLKGNGQRGFSDADLPSPDEKRMQYEIGKTYLEDIGYVEIGMDHFALKTDTLYKSMETENLHRNFMGYTSSKTQLMIGLGVSSIGDSWYGFSQNTKALKMYYDLLDQNLFPIMRGHLLSDEDMIIRKHILNLMCHFKTSWQDKALFFPELPDVLIRLEEMVNDGLIEIADKAITVNEKGKPYIRNVCMAFDLLLQRNKPATRLFSMTV